MSTCNNNPEKSSTANINKRTPSDIHNLRTAHLMQQKFNYLFIHKFNYYRDKNCMKNFFLDLREHATIIINYDKKEMIPLTKEEKKMHRRQKTAINSKKS